MGQMAGGGNGDFGGETSGGGSSLFGGGALKKGIQGLGQGLQTYGNQQSAIQNRPGFMPQMGQDQPVSADYFLPQKKTGANNLAFYGGPNG